VIGGGPESVKKNGGKLGINCHTHKKFPKNPAFDKGPQRRSLNTKKVKSKVTTVGKKRKWGFTKKEYEKDHGKKSVDEHE